MQTPLSLRMLKISGLFLALSMHSFAQPPSTETIILSLKTMNKSLAGCRESYKLVATGTSAPLIKLVIGADSYNKDLESLDGAEEFVSLLIEHPNRITGKGLVAVLSTSDDFSIGVGSAESEILRALVRGDHDITPEMATELVPLSASLNACQRSLFNAGDDYVELVMRFVGEEDEALAALKAKRNESRK